MNTKNNHKKAWDTRGRTGTILANGYRHGAKDGIRLYEHRRIMEEIIGRKLRIDESVHHKDGNKLNNYPNNLELFNKSEHSRIHALARGLGKDRLGISPVNKISQKTINKIKQLRLSGLLLREIQKKVKISWPTVCKYAKK